MRTIRCIIPFAILLISALFTGSCSRQIFRPPSPDSLVIFPPPPARARIQFLTGFSGSEEFRGEKGSFRRYLFGEEEPVNIVKPYGITVRSTRIYICDTGIAGLVIADLADGSFDYFVPGGKGQLQLPINCDLDDRGMLYIADANRRQIVVFDEALDYVDAFGEEKDFKPTDVAVSDGKIWVANVTGHAVHVYDRETHELLERIPGNETGKEGYIRQVTNISIQGNQLFVSDFGDFNVKRFSLEGVFLGAVGGPGNSPGTFTRPKGLALDPGGNLYVVDAAFENVQLFNTEGMILMHMGGAYGGPGAMYLPAAVEVSVENLSYFQPYVDPGYDLKYLVYVTNQYGPSKVNIYGYVDEKQTEQ